MESQTTSDGGGLEAILQQMRIASEWSARREGEAPRDIPPASLLAGLHLRALEQSKTHRQISSVSERNAFYTTQLPHPYHPCTMPADELEPILISEMRLETHHRGRKVFLRVLTPPLRMNATITVVEDRAGAGAFLALYRQLDESLMPSEEFVYHGRVCMLKDPFFKVAADGSYSLRVDHVNDIVWLAEDDEQVPAEWRTKSTLGNSTSLQIRTQGNDAVKKAQWAKAVRLYTSAIQIAETKEEAQLAYLNRSYAHLNLGRFEDALSDASNQEGASREKGLFREARALYELSRYEESLEKLLTISVEFPQNKAIKPHIDLAQARLQEFRYGWFSFQSMYKQASKTEPIIDCATYSKPVEVRPSDGRGRGLFTTRPVSAGELLLCEKAFTYCYGGEDASSDAGKHTLLMKVGCKDAVMGGNASLITRIVQKLQQNPDISRPFLDLYTGDYQPASVKEVDGRPVVDTFFVVGAISTNSFGTPRTSLSDFRRSIVGRSETQDHSYLTSGAWILASHIDHSCMENCHRTFIGDMQIIRATRDLPEGTELLFQYKLDKPLSSYEEVQTELENWGFNCDCSICIDLKKTSQHTLSKRKDLSRELDRCLKPDKDSLPKDLEGAKVLLEELQATYTTPIRASPSASEQSTQEPTITPRFPLVDPYLVLSSILFRMSSPNEAIAATVKGLEAAGFDIIAPPVPETSFTSTPVKLLVKSWGAASTSMVLAFWNLFQAYGGTGTEAGRTAKRYLITSYEIMIGESETAPETFAALKEAA